MSVGILTPLGDRAAPAVPALAKALRDEDWFVRMSAAHALGQIGLKAKAAVPALLDLLQDPNQESELHAAIVQTLNRIEPGLFERMKKQ